jgi:two-component system OmpR family response regulator
MARVMLLETDNLLARVMTGYLENCGHTVDWQVDPQEAIISLDLQPADLVILELILAGRSGVEFLYELRSYPDWRGLPVVIYSSVPQREIGISLGGFAELNIISYHQKHHTDLETLRQSIEASLIPA